MSHPEQRNPLRRASRGTRSGIAETADQDEAADDFNALTLLSDCSRSRAYHVWDKELKAASPMVEIIG